MKTNGGSKVAVNAFLIVINWCTNYEVSRGSLVYRLDYGLEVLGSNPSRENRCIQLVPKRRMSRTVPVMQLYAFQLTAAYFI